MLNIPREKVLERWDKLPQSIREAIFSEENADIIQQIGEANRFTENNIQILSVVAGDVLRGFIKHGELAREIVKDLKIDYDTASTIAKEINDKIFSPLKSDLEKVYEPLTETQTSELLSPQLNLEPQTTPFPAPLLFPMLKKINAPEPQTIKPSFKETPFILHQEEEVKPEAEPKIQPSIPRPTFYKPASREEYNGEAAPVTARLELGNEEEKKSKEPQTARTEKPRVRIVHYSDLRTTVSPFGPAENAFSEVESRKKDLEQFSAPETKPQSIQENEEMKTASRPDNVINLKKGNVKEDAIKPDVHPDNVINLKDLPL